jgi:hypothetical protein
MSAFTDQFARRDPRSTQPALPFAFNLAAPQAHRLACALVEGVPIEKLTQICRALSARFIDVFPGLGLDSFKDWNGEEPPLAKHLDFGVSLSVVYGAFALWKLNDFRDLLENHTGTGTDHKPSPELVYPAALALMGAMRGCLLGQQFQIAEARKAATSQRARRNVLTRHAATTERHRQEAISKAAAFHAQGRFKKPTDCARHLMNDIAKHDGHDGFYSERTICQWLWDAGWTRSGWPNRPPTT